jgi:hypothetical protein
MRQSGKLGNRGQQGAQGSSVMFRPTALFFALFISLLAISGGAANSQGNNRSRQPGYYYLGSQNQVTQYNGSRTDYRGVMNGGVNVGPVGIQGYNYGNTFSYPYQQTQYRNVPQFYYSNGNSCGVRVYSDYQLQSGSPVYYQSGQPYRQSVTPIYSQGGTYRR